MTKNTHGIPTQKNVIRLRPYQAEPARAILRDARLGDGNTFTVLMSRQAGKNELSAWIEKVLLVANMANREIGRAHV